MKAEIAWEGPTQLGEGPLWHPQENVLYFIDIVKKTLECLDWNTQTHHSWQMPDYIGSVVAKKGGGLLVTVGQYICEFERETGTLTELAKIIPDNREDLRMNDGKVDRAGRFWVGVANLEVKNPQGGLFCYEPDGTLMQKETGITISNGLGFSPDDKLFYYTDGLKYRIYEYDFDLETGSLSNRRIFLQLEKSPVEPDGLTVDSEGFIWGAAWESNQVFRYTPAGEIDCTVDLPVRRPTSCIIGGKDFKTLFITSCSQSIGETKALPTPSGAIFVVPLQVPGLPEPLFG